MKVIFNFGKFFLSNVHAKKYATCDLCTRSTFRVGYYIDSTNTGVCFLLILLQTFPPNFGTTYLC